MTDKATTSEFIVSLKDNLMSDIRSKLYSRYVSTFKGTSKESSSRNELLWLQKKYMPLLSGLSKNSSILELGCGQGGFLAFLSKEGFTNTTGIDISPEQIEIAQRRGANAVHANVFEYLKIHNHNIDAIVAIDFIEHFSKDEVLPLMELSFNALKKGGILILQTPNGEGLFPGQNIYGDMSHLTIFTPSSLHQLLAMVGYKDFIFLETGPAPISFKGRVRLILWSLIKRVANTIRRIETGKTQKLWTENFICACKT
jgi:2-polyprenyl-3-methyl-5-hydroxy-6-metoxy-1,4-benzoquinol methylase